MQELDELHFSRTTVGWMGFGNTMASIVGGRLQILCFGLDTLTHSWRSCSNTGIAAGPVLDRYFRQRYKVYVIVVFILATGEWEHPTAPGV